MIKFDGFDELEKSLDKISNNASELDGTHDVSFETLFTTSFMKENTDFDDMQKFLDEFDSEIPAEDFEEIQYKDEWNFHVQSHSKFKSWDDMIGKASEEYLSRKLFNDI